MKIALFYKKFHLKNDERVLSLAKSLRDGGAGVEFFCGNEIPNGFDIVLALGGDGTFLTAATLLGGRNIPLMGVNFGRVGFLAENDYTKIATAVLNREYVIDRLPFLKVSGFSEEGFCKVNPTALNEVTVTLQFPGLLSINVTVDGTTLPTYWADGIIISTSAGSTAYSLSAGGPIVTPRCEVLTICPLAPHNLNVRPLVIPSSSKISLSFKSKSETIILSTDNRSQKISSHDILDISLAQFSLSRARLKDADFFQALKTKLFWGEDMRNQ
ncbi:MAG: NAD(+)/NADH kinase [Bacteroidales bacterium]|nr:NAD(+)/NADH kinase [Bacteroidales bacterium]